MNNEKQLKDFLPNNESTFYKEFNIEDDNPKLIEEKNIMILKIMEILVIKLLLFLLILVEFISTTLQCS